jgi:septal ring factor EnvC (AmiA/AmiB activator)
MKEAIKKQPRKFITKIVLLFAAFVLICAVVSVNGQSRKELEALRNKKEKEIALTKKKLQETKLKKEKSEEVLNTLRKQISQKRELAGIYHTELEKIEIEISHLNEDVDALNFEIDKLKTEFSNLVVQGFKSRSAASKINFLFSANTFPKTIRRFIYLKKLLDFRKKQMALIQVKKDEKANRIVEMELRKDEKMGIVRSTEQIRQELEEDENSEESLISELQIKETKLQADLRKKEKAYRELDQALKKAIEREIELARQKAERERQKEIERKKEQAKNQQKNNSNPKSTPKAPAKTVDDNYTPVTGSDFGNMRSRLPWPVNGGYIAQGFGTHRHPTLPDVTVINNGVNIAGKPGSPVKAVFAGEVSTILQIPGMMNTVLIKHGDFFTVYARLETTSVKKGDKVKANQSIGTLGTDSEGKTELHFEVWQGNQRTDPQNWLMAR